MSETPLLDELEKGRWPSFVTEMKRMAAVKPYSKNILLQLERSYVERVTHWKHGGIVGVRGYGGGVIGRYSDLPPEVMQTPEVHTLRVAQPAGWFYSTKALRKLCDVWEKHGSGFINLHGSTGDIILLGAQTASLQPCFEDLISIGFDLGGSGGDVRTLSCCGGPAFCQWSCIDTLDIYHELTMELQDEIHRPRFPYKFKIKIAGCPNDCVAALARADLAIIGTWRDSIKIDQEAVREYAKKGVNIAAVAARCPPQALEWDGKELRVIPEDCTRCMKCLSALPKAILPGDDRGVSILLGGKATILQGAFLGWVIVPFMKADKPYRELKELTRKILDWWDENAKTRERVGELVYRVGMRNFLKAIGQPPAPQMVYAPRANPYYFWSPEELEEVK
ncbi:MAG: dissimilatory-type sulfite reductase subunit alpha [Aigarchaeota archaeon]|nr:dissimilatory-type sulfite reductase subunit alpha [Aigarchaeota archaeon]MCX8192781.1 dissimilatory-type sulfite reductase subunit alpha [Nitrososphaeria archaeon]MDW7986028.1 dissimilatory-type sulfite reductase subunit alpha [Nitrososphaerota archaeon]